MRRRPRRKYEEDVPFECDNQMAPYAARPLDIQEQLRARTRQHSG